MLASLVLLVGALSALAFSGIAGATIPSGGQSNSLIPVAPFTAGTPFASGQTVTVSVGPSALTPAQNVSILECAAPNGVLPTLPSQCDPNTIQGDSIIPAADGSFNYVSSYQVYALPSPALGEGPTVTPKCSNTAATQCVLGIFDNFNDFTAPHVFSQAFYIQVTGPETGTIVNPGDGSPPAAVGPSATASTVIASPTTAVSNGSDSSTITVTINGLNGSATVPVSGAPVTLAGSVGTHSVITPPTPLLTDSSGVATFSVNDATAEAVQYTATTGSVTVMQTATVTFNSPAPSAAHSLVVASPASVAADGSTPSTITVTVNDQAASAKPISGVTVSLATSAGTSSTVTPVSPVTDASGVATFTVTDSHVEPVTYTVTAGATVLTTTAQVTFGSLAVSPATSTVVAALSTATVGAGQGTTVKVTLLTAAGSFPVPNKSVLLTPDAGKSAVATPASVVTDAAGTATFAVTDTVVESVSFTATDTTDANLVITQTAMVDFQNAVPPTVSATLSTVTFSPAAAPADGTNPINVFVTVRNTLSQPVAGDVVTIVPTTPDVHLLVTPNRPAGSTVDGATDSSGVATFQLRNTVAGSVPLTITDTTANVVIQPTAGLQAVFTAGGVDGAQSTLTASPGAVAADGTAHSTLTATLLDHFGNPVQGKTVHLDQGGGKSVITPASAKSDAGGVVTFNVTDTSNERVTYYAVDVDDGNLVLTTSAVVVFGTPPPSPPFPPSCVIVSNYTSVPADGKTAATVSVLLYDAFGVAVSGRTVALTATGGKPGIAPASAPSNSSGSASFAITDATAETVTLTAVDTADNIAIPGLVTITFTTPGAPGPAAPGLNAPMVGTTPAPGGGGYWMVGADGGIFNFGSAGFFGSTGALALNKPIVGMAAAPDGKGYWLVAADGGIFNFGSAGFFGSTGSLHLNQPIVGMAAAPDGKGYWLVAADGGIFNFGSAGFFGSTGALALNKPIVGMAAAPDGMGYWTVAADGGIFNFGSAGFFGSTGSLHLNKPMVGMAASSDGKGYWLVATDGGIFNFGSAGFFGSTGSLHLNKPIVGMSALPGDNGYWLVAADGGLFAINAPFYGSAV